jgi:acetyl-CoA acetyltransferase
MTAAFICDYVRTPISLPHNAERVNPHGAIALGHPLGTPGARLAGTTVHALERTGGRRAVATMCTGVGRGIAMLIERV